MPLDPRIPLSGNPVQPIDLAQIQVQASAIQTARENAQKRIQDAKDQAAVRSALEQTQGDYEAAAKLLDRTAPFAATMLRDKLNSQREQIQKITTTHLDNYLKGTTLAGHIYNSVRPGDEAGLQAANKAVLGLFADDPDKQQLVALLPKQATPEELDRAKGLAQTVTEHFNQSKQAADEFFGGKYETGLARSFSLAQTPEQWAGVQELAKHYQTPQALIASFGEFSPEAVQAAKARTLTPEQTATLSGVLPTGGQTITAKTAESVAQRAKIDDERQAGQAAETARHNRVMENKPTGTSLGAGQGLRDDPDALRYVATQYRVLGAQGIPTRIGEADKVAIIKEAAAQGKALGQSPAQSVQKQAAFKSDAAALTQMRKMQSSAEAFENKALAQTTIIDELSPKVGRTVSPALNALWLAGKTAVTGDSPTSQLYNAISTFSSEYAKIMEGSTGSVAASSDSARTAAKKLIDASMNPKTMTDVLALMKREMRLTLDGYDATIDHITGRMGGGPSAGSEPTVTVTRDPKTGALIVKRGGGD